MAKPLRWTFANVLACIAGGISGRQGCRAIWGEAASVSRWRTREREQGSREPKAAIASLIGSMPPSGDPGKQGP